MAICGWWATAPARVPAGYAKPIIQGFSPPRHPWSQRARSAERHAVSWRLFLLSNTSQSYANLRLQMRVLWACQGRTAKNVGRAVVGVPVCGASSFKKQLTAAGFQLKGSGWYVTDFRGGEGAKAAKPADGESASTSATAPAGSDSSPPASGAAPATASPATPAASTPAATPAASKASGADTAPKAS